MNSADGKGSASDLSASKKIEAGELSSSKRIESKHSIDEDIKNICEKGYDDGSEHETLSRNHPLAEFIKENKGALKGLSEEEFKAKYNEYMKGREDKNGPKLSRPPSKRQESGEGYSEAIDESEMKDELTGNDFLERIVLKFTTLSETNSEAPSFTIDKTGAEIGRNTSNEVSVPSDTRLADKGHSFIEHSNGAFYLVDGGYDFSASIRISVGSKKQEWVCNETTRFSAGNSVFEVKGISEDGCLILDIIEGPLKGERRLIPKKGATLGRSSDNVISIPDRELSRRHSKVEYIPDIGKFCVSDTGSTNGTYMQLVGPYAGKYKLCINDHILVGRTGFSINRYDFGISEEMGYRQSMEDSCTILQHMDLPALAVHDMAPQSFFGVFDGHGGSNASLYLSQNLHVNVGNALTTVSPDLKEYIDGIRDGTLNDSHPMKEHVDKIVIEALQSSFMKTDADFVTTSPHSQNGSTATTALILGRRLYCANTGDSRTFICRNFKPIRMTEDHKPSREDEQKRIRDAGGFVINNRVMGELAVSRAFGDAEFKKGIQSIIDEEGVKMPSGGKQKSEDGDGQKNWDQPLIIAKPDVEVTTITDDDQFLLLACDGLFDVFTEEEVVEFVKESLEDTGDPQKCCEALTDDAINNRNSRDNVSVILVILNKWY